jgi:hypothetical protein
MKKYFNIKAWEISALVLILIAMSTFDTLRDVQVSIFLKIFQVSNGYMQLIASSVLVSNRRPENSAGPKIRL